MDLTWLKAFRRPLKEFNRKSIAVLVGLWVVVLLGTDGCSTSPGYWAAAYLATTVCLVLWVNHLPMAPVNRAGDAFRLVGFALYDLISIFALVILACIPFSLIHTDCYSSRAKVSELILASADYRTQIAERFESQKTLDNIGQGIQVKLTHRVHSGMVTSDGIIVLTSEDPPAVVFVSPHIEAGKLIWQCSGVPKTIMPKSCTEQPIQ